MRLAGRNSGNYTFPRKHPRNDDVDPVMLGEEMHLTGGQIRNAALHAQPFSQQERVLQFHSRILLVLYGTELAKEGGEMMPSSLGKLAQSLPEEVNHAVH